MHEKWLDWLNDKMMHGATCSLLSAGDRSNIILRVPKSNHNKQGKFKDNIIKQQFGWRRKVLLPGDC